MTSRIESNIDTKSKKFKNNELAFKALLDTYKAEQTKIKLGGGVVNIQKQHDKGRMTARERIVHLLGEFFLEIGLYAAYDMYKEVGEISSGGVVTANRNGSFIYTIGDGTTDYDVLSQNTASGNINRL